MNESVDMIAQFLRLTLRTVSSPYFILKVLNLAFTIFHQLFAYYMKVFFQRYFSCEVMEVYW